ncbi:hypothetical protein EMGBS6_08510 [Opitutia bacterium]|nr:hypothetical protein EMGBS6_08510 [Opitutae bacterium]
MSNSHPSDFKRNLSREIAAYFIVVLCALPIRFWLYSETKDDDGWVSYLASSTFSYIAFGLIGAVFVSKLSLRTKLILTFILVAL